MALVLMSLLGMLNGWLLGHAYGYAAMPLSVVNGLALGFAVRGLEPVFTRRGR